MSRALSFILVTVLLDALGFGLAIPALPHLVEGLVEGGPAAASRAFGLLVSVYAVMLFLGAPVVGRLSDRFGRRPVILLALAGAALDHVVAALAGSFWLLFAARAVAGACGANAAAASAYVADVTPPERRAAAFGLAGAMFGLGLVLGPALGGLLADLGPRVPFWTAAGLSALNLLYGLVVLPESLPAGTRRPLAWNALNPFAGLMGWRRSRLVGGLLCAFFLYMLGQSAVQATWVLFAKVKLGWGPAEAGASLGVLGIAAILAQAVAAPRLIARIGEERALFAGLCATVAACLGYAMAAQGWQVYAVTALITLSMITGPAAQAIVSRAVAAQEQGQLQGTITGVISLATIFGPLAGASVFAWGTAREVPMPGVAFLLAAGLTLCALACVAYALGRGLARSGEEAA